MIQIDVVIPSYRLQTRYLKSIIELPVPEQVDVHYYIVADNPAMDIPQDLAAVVDGSKAVIVRNEVNLGASRSRNKGLEQGNGTWVLFLDDDIQPSHRLLFSYAKAIEANPESPGFFGETVFPEPVNSFTRGTVIGDMLYFFSYARYHDETICTTTSNVMVNRKAVGDIRFRDTFPMKGGGEDFAFFQELYMHTRKTLKSVKDAEVYHGWWHGGKRNYSQFIRWSYADYELFRLFPESSYRSFPNVVEAFVAAVIIGLVCLFVSGSLIPLLSMSLGVIMGELVVVFFFLAKYKGVAKSRYAPEVMLVRAAADLGRVQGIVATGKFGDFLKRPNFSGYKANRHFHFWPAVKFVSYVVASIVLFLLMTWFVGYPV